MKTLLRCLPALVLLAGCQKEEIVDGPADYRVFIRPVVRDYSSDGTAVTSRLFSYDSEAQPTGGYCLITKLQRQANQLRLIYSGVKAPARDAYVTMAPAPASSEISLYNLPPQVYQLEITVRNRRTTGTLDLTATPARVTTADTTVAAVR